MAITQTKPTESSTRTTNWHICELSFLLWTVMSGSTGRHRRARSSGLGRERDRRPRGGGGGDGGGGSGETNGRLRSRREGWGGRGRWGHQSRFGFLLFHSRRNIFIDLLRKFIRRPKTNKQTKNNKISFPYSHYLDISQFKNVQKLHLFWRNIIEVHETCKSKEY